MKKGFALTLSMLVLIFFLALILSIESQRVSIEEKTRSSHARMRALSSLFSDLDSPAFNYSLSQLAKRSLHDVDMEVINNGEYLQTDADEEICGKFTQKFVAYLNSVALRASDMGLELSYTDPTCQLELVGPYDAKLSVSTDISAFGNGVKVSKSLSREVIFSVQGVYDPMLAVESSKQCSSLPNPSECAPVLRPIINSSIPVAELEDVDIVANGKYGRGWAYGEVVSASRADALGENAWFNKILLVKGDELDAWRSKLGRFRGVILEGEDNSEYSSSSGTIIAEDGSTCNYEIETWVERSPCIYCGRYYIVSPQGCSSVNWGSMFDTYEEVRGKVHAYNGQGTQPNVPFVKITSHSVSSGDKVLISNLLREFETTEEYPPTREDAVIYNIEDQRAAVLCANYFAMHSGPSILSRLEGNLNANDGLLGLETFAVGEWARQPRSRVANEYYRNIPGDKIMGMPGCITMGMCNDPLVIDGNRIDEEEMVIGKFRISDGRAGDYGMDEIRVD